MRCPEPDTWIDLASGAKAPEAVLDHLSTCADCRAEASALVRSDRPAPAIPPALRARILRATGAGLPWLRIAAAGLLAAGAGFWLLRPGAPLSPESSAAPSLAEAPLPSAPAGRILDLGASRVCCVPGARASVRGAEAQLEEGKAWVEAASPVALRTPLGLLRIEKGEAGVCLDPAPRASWSLLREAWAAPRGRLTLVLLEGASVRLEAASWTGPCKVRLESGRPALREDLDEASLAEAFAWRDEAEGAGPWRELLGAAVVGAAGPEGRTSLFPVPPGAVRVALEAEILAPSGSQTALCFPYGGGTVSTVVGAAGTSGWQTVRLRLDGRHLRVYAGASPVATAALPLEKGLRPAGDSPAVGMAVWSGPVQVRRLRWRPLR